MPWGTGQWGKTTVHVLEEVVYSYTAWIPSDWLRSNEVAKGVAVSALLRRHDIAGKAREWICEFFQVE